MLMLNAVVLVVFSAALQAVAIPITQYAVILFLFLLTYSHMRSEPRRTCPRDQSRVQAQRGQARRGQARRGRSLR